MWFDSIFKDVKQSTMIKDISFDDSEIFSDETPGDCEARGVVMPEKEVGAGWVDDTLSTSTYKFWLFIIGSLIFFPNNCFLIQLIEVLHSGQDIHLPSGVQFEVIHTLQRHNKCSQYNQSKGKDIIFIKKITTKVKVKI